MGPRHVRPLQNTLIDVGNRNLVVLYKRVGHPSQHVVYVLCLIFHKESIQMGPKHVRPFQNSLIDVDSENTADWSLQAWVIKLRRRRQSHLFYRSEATLQIIVLTTLNVEATYSRSCDRFQFSLPFPSCSPSDLVPVFLYICHIEFKFLPYESSCPYSVGWQVRHNS